MALAFFSLYSVKLTAFSFSFFPSLSLLLVQNKAALHQALQKLLKIHSEWENSSPLWPKLLISTSVSHLPLTGGEQSCCGRASPGQVPALLCAVQEHPRHGHRAQSWQGHSAGAARITENKLQWALTHIFHNVLRTSPGIAELSWSISGRRRKRI